MGYSVSMQVSAAERNWILACFNLLSRQIIDRQQTDQHDPFPFDAGAPILFFSIYDDERLTHHKAGLSSRGNRFQQGPTARQDIVYDQRAIPGAHGSFNQLS